MQINTLKITYKRKKRKTIGRGGKKGIYSGKGNKGQKARSGAHVKPLFEGGRSTLIDHMKKKKGFKAVNGKLTAVNVAMLGKKMKDGGPVNAESLIKAGFIDRIEARRGVKIVGNSEIKQKFQVEKNIQVSAGSKKVIEKAGGEVETK